MTSNVQQNKLLEEFSFIWLDKLTNHSLEHIRFEEFLRTHSNDFKSFQSIDLCLQYIKSSPKYQFILITNDHLCKKLIRHINDLPQVYSIYIFGSYHLSNRWVKHYPKIKGFIVTLDDLLSHIRSNQQSCCQTNINEPMSIRFCRQNNEFNDDFIYSQLLNEYFLTVEPMSRDISELLSLCKDDEQVYIIQDLKRNYSSNKALRWFIKEKFLSNLLNEAFRSQNIDVLSKFHFFINDIQRLIEESSTTKYQYIFKSYLMSNEVLEAFKSSIGEFLSIDGFFQVNIHRQQAIFYLSNMDIRKNFEKVLFEIYIDPEIDSTKVLCELTPFSGLFDDEKVILTSGLIFHLIDMYLEDYGKLKIWIIRLKLSTKKHRQLKSLFNTIKDQYNFENMELLSLGNVLRKRCEFDQAEKFYLRILKELPKDHSSLADCYYGLALIFDIKGDYTSSLNWHEKSLTLKKDKIDKPDASLGYSYNSIANVYQKQGDFKQALEYYHKALEVFKEILDENHPDIAMCLNNMGCAYASEKQYSEALECHRKALEIKKLHLPTDHLNLSATHNNLAIIYGNTNQLDLALEHFYISLNIKYKSLPIDLADIALTLKNIGLIYEIRGDFSQAKRYYEKSVNLRRRILSSKHCDLIQVEQDLKRVSLKTK